MKVWGKDRDRAFRTRAGKCASSENAWDREEEKCSTGSWYDSMKEGFGQPFDHDHDHDWGYPTDDYVEPSVRPPARDARIALVQYNDAWSKLDLHGGTAPGDVPWPTYDLQPESLSRVQDHDDWLLAKVTNHQFQLQLWNAFRFFVRGCGLKPAVTVEHFPDFGKDQLQFHIKTPCSREKLETLKIQARKENFRWHEDRLIQRGSADLKGDERAKAVFMAAGTIANICALKLRDVTF